MDFYLWETQNGGCDYTIGCGVRLRKLKAKTREEAEIEAVEEVYPYWNDEGCCGIDEAYLLEVSSKTDLSDPIETRIEQAIHEKWKEVRAALGAKYAK